MKYLNYKTAILFFVFLMFYQYAFYGIPDKIFIIISILASLNCGIITKIQEILNDIDNEFNRKTN